MLSRLTDKQREMLLEWAKWLRSGVYKQTSSCLADEDGYCCLGVACDIFLDEDWVWDETSSRWFLPRPDLNHIQAMLPDELRETLGLERNVEESRLAAWNDGGRSFEFIADRLEEWANA